MKILSKLDLYGLKISGFNWYKYIGFAGVYVSANSAYCNSCNCRFTFSPRAVNKKFMLTCPQCGQRYGYKQMAVSREFDKDLPYVVKIKLYEFKYKIELRIDYTTCNLQKDVHSEDGALSHKVKEIYVFDIANKRSIWRKYKNGQIVDEMAIGYVSDYEKLKENTALWYFSADVEPVYESDSFYMLMKKLRFAVMRKMKDIHGIRLASLYIAKLPIRYRVFGNVLNTAHKVRFFDSPNIVYTKELFEILDVCSISADFEQDFQNSPKPYTEKLLELLKLPKLNMVKKHTDYSNIHVLKAVYVLDDRQLANSLFDLYLQNKRFFDTDKDLLYMTRIEKCLHKINIMVDFLIAFREYYSHVKLNVIFKKYDKLTDILRLWKSSSEQTRAKFASAKVPFKNLHDWLSIEVSKQADKEQIFTIPQDVLTRFKLFMMNHHFDCVEKYSQLKYIASSLKNCCAGYKDRINSDCQLIVISDDTGKPRVLIEVNNNAIVQAKLYSNMPVRNDYNLNHLVMLLAQQTNLKIKTDDVNRLEILEEIAV